MHQEGNEKMWLKFQTGGSGLGGRQEQQAGGGAQLGLSVGWKEACSSVAPGSWGWCLPKGATASKAKSSGLLSVLVCFAQGRNHERWDSVLTIILEPMGKHPLLPGQFTAAV